ncbi:MAG: AtpZ/AtpI family protein [Actinobacteria bacterium]|nr:AtpZ/AtpI family protein [Actinomycetota bacterium]
MSAEHRRAEGGALRLVAVGSQFAGVFAVTTLIGLWLDARLGTAPWLLIVGAIVGFAGATWMLIRALVESDTDEDEHR